MKAQVQAYRRKNGFVCFAQLPGGKRCGWRTVAAEEELEGSCCVVLRDFLGVDDVEISLAILDNGSSAEDVNASWSGK